MKKITNKQMGNRLTQSVKPQKSKYEDAFYLISDMYHNPPKLYCNVRSK